MWCVFFLDYFGNWKFERGVFFVENNYVVYFMYFIYGFIFVINRIKDVFGNIIE